jgi:hypothetical protein
MNDREWPRLTVRSARNRHGLGRPNRISSSDRGRPDRFKLDQRASPVCLGRHCTAVNCNPNCNPVNRLDRVHLCAAWTEEGDHSRRYDRRQQEHAY